MTGLEPCLGNFGGLNKDLRDPPAASASAHSALNGDLRAKAPLGFVSTSFLDKLQALVAFMSQPY